MIKGKIGAQQNYRNKERIWFVEAKRLGHEQHFERINQSNCLNHFPICQEANGVSKESTCADNMELL